MGLRLALLAWLKPRLRADGNQFYIAVPATEESFRSMDRRCLLTRIRMFAHFLDKELQISASSPHSFSSERLAQLSRLLDFYKRSFDCDRDDVRWAEGIRDLYASALNTNDLPAYPWEEKQPTRIDESDFVALIASRRSVRRFRKEEIAEETIAKILALASWAPTTCNMQLIRYVVARDPAIRERLAGGGMRGSMSPCVVAVAVDIRCFPSRAAECAVFETGPAAQNIMLAAHFYGIGSCYVAGPAIDRTCREILRLEPFELATALVWLGHYDAPPPAPPRRDLKEIITWM